VKLVSECFKEDVLEVVVKRLNMTFFSGQEWVFQQESISARKPRQLRSGWGRFLLAFISAEDWLSGSADPKSMDNKE
jgi:hypothetical protein